MNLERWRWLPRELEPRNIRVYIPSYRLAVYEPGGEVLGMNVVVGRPSWETPMFSDEMTHLEVNPDWHIPAGLFLEEMLPKIRKQEIDWTQFAVDRWGGDSSEPMDPAAINWARMDGESWSRGGYRVKQLPGPSNPMGGVKFIFPNRFSVYFHDTPSRSEFARRDRAFSHGCIRLEKALDLADYLLRGEPERLDTLHDLVRAAKPRTLPLSRPMPVHMLYRTAWVDSLERLHTAPDAYHWDAALSRLLQEASGSPLQFFKVKSVRDESHWISAKAVLKSWKP
jgi:murein L,D-transpeptidase YcbB/YkuD